MSGQGRNRLGMVFCTRSVVAGNRSGVFF